MVWLIVCRYAVYVSFSMCIFVCVWLSPRLNIAGDSVDTHLAAIDQDGVHVLISYGFRGWITNVPYLHR